MKKKETIEVISRFTGKYAFLDNSFVGHEFTYEGNKFNSAEAAYQSAKCLDLRNRYRFTKMNPANAHKVGQLVRIRPDWEMVKDKVMEDVIWAKFAGDKGLSTRLIATNPAILINGTDSDTYWGMGENQGENKLGKILTKVRDKLIGQFNVDFDRSTAVRTTSVKKNLYYPTDKYSEY